MNRRLLSEDARRVVVDLADAEARRRGRSRIGTEDLLLGLLAEPGGIASQVIGCDADAARAASMRLDAEALEAFGIRAKPIMETHRARRSRLSFSNGARSAMMRAVRLARRQKGGRITSAHLAASVLSAEDPDEALTLVRALGADVVGARDASLALVAAEDAS